MSYLTISHCTRNLVKIEMDLFLSVSDWLATLDLVLLVDHWQLISNFNWLIRTNIALIESTFFQRPKTDQNLNSILGVRIAQWQCLCFALGDPGSNLHVSNVFQFFLNMTFLINRLPALRTGHRLDTVVRTQF